MSASLPNVGELPIGTKLGRYVIRGTLGAGGMGVVYKAVDLDSGASVALKTLHERDPVALYHLKREFRSLTDVSHPNLVSLGELATEDGLPFFTMELVDGIQFQRWLDLGPPRTEPAYFERLRRALRQIATGLRALHGAGKIHCDLKPSNVLVTRDERMVIVDFGLVRELAMSSHESSGRIWGTALYMAPEQARTPKVGPAADWYSLGIMLYRALTGVAPFRGNQMEILLDKQEQEPPAPSTVASGVPPDLDELCTDLLRLTPDERPGSAEVLERLGGAHHEDASALTRDTASLTLRSVFVGRREELAVLQRSLARSRQEHRGVLLSGASGVGKTSLIRHFLELVRVRRSDSIVLTGRCYRRDSMPYRALDAVVDSLSDYLRRLDQVELAHMMPPDAALLGRVFPVLSRVPAVASAALSSPPQQYDLQVRTRVFTALRQLLSRLATRAPVVVFIDDLQWADADGLGLLADVFRGPDAPRVLLLGTVRMGRDRVLPPRLEQLMHGHGKFAELRLAPLPPDDAEELAELLLDRLDPSLLHSAPAIASETSGHPLFIDELVRFHARSRATAPRSTSGMDDAIWQRLNALDQAGRRLMTALAVAEVPLSIDTASLATGCAVAHLEQLASTLAREHLIRAVPTAEGNHALEPYHDRIREVLVDRIGDEVCTRWHEQLADALFKTGAAKHAPTQLLRHLTLAGKPHQAARLAAHAAERASAALAFDTAAELYRLALELGDQGAPRTDVAALRRGLAEALVNAGRGSEAAAVLEELASSEDDEQTRTDYLRRAAEQLLLTGHLDSGLILLGSIATECGVRVPPAGRRAMVSLAWERLKLRLRGNRWREEQACNTSEADLLSQDVHHSLGTILGLVDPVRGMALVSRATLLAYRLGVRDRLVRALATEAISRAAIGDHQRATELLEQGSRLAHEAGDLGTIAWVAGATGFVAYAMGRFAEVIPAIDRAIEIHASLPREERARMSTGGAYEIGVLRHYRMLALVQMGRCKELRQELHEWLHDARRRGDGFTAANAARGLNIVWLLDDHPERAREQLSADLWTPPHDSFHLQHWMALRAGIQIHLYSGTVAYVRQELGAEIERSERSALLRADPLSAEHHWMIGRLTLAEIEAGVNRSRAGRRRVKTAARQLERLGLPQTQVTAALLRAGLAYQDGDHRAAVVDLLRAEVVASRAGLRLLQATAQRRRGQLIGGSEGEELIVAVDDWANGEGIRRPDKLVRMYAPGFDRVRS